MKSLPNKFIQRGGEISFACPYKASNVTYSFFVFKANITALEKICSSHLSAATHSKPSYKPITPYIIVSYGQFDALRSLTHPDSKRGYVKQKEFGFWLFCSPVSEYNGENFATKLTSYSPYLFVDDQFAAISGREIHGFKKELAKIQLPQSPIQEFCLRADVFPVLHHDTLCEEREIVTISPPTETTSYQSTVSSFKSFEGFLRFFTETYILPHAETPTTSIKYLFNLLESILSNTYLITTLKQTRSAVDSELADLQMVLETPMEITKLSSWKILPPGYKMVIQDYPCHPICQDLGLPPNQPIESIISFEMTFDFVFHNARPVLPQ